VARERDAGGASAGSIAAAGPDRDEAGKAREARPLRVLMVVEKLFGLGGAQQQALRLARGLRRHGVEARIVTGRWQRSEPRRAQIDGVPVVSVFTALKMFHVKGLRKFAVYIYVLSLLFHLWRRRREYDLLHVHSATASGFGVALAGRWFRKPTVMKVMASGGWSEFKRMRQGGEAPGSALMLRPLRRVRRVICLNGEVEEECLREGFRPEQLVRIPNGFPVREVEPCAAYPERDEVEILFVGRLDAQKNPYTLLEALALLARSPEGVRLRARFLGDGPEAAQVRARARELGLLESAAFHGRVDDVPGHLRRADVFVLPSLSEGISNALLEALAHGLPCVATRIPGNAELIRDGETGLLVAPGSADDLAAALRRLAADRALRERLGRAGRVLVEERFDMEAVAGRYAGLYRELIAESGG
jgi:glycosyltransferase involved in cell wall biosynthesis